METEKKYIVVCLILFEDMGVINNLYVTIFDKFYLFECQIFYCLKWEKNQKSKM